MEVKTDIEIAREAKKQPIQQIGEKLQIPSDHLLPFGHDKAKLSAEFIKSQESKQDGKLIIGVPSLKFLWSKHDEELKHFNRYNWKELCDVCSSYKLKKKYGFNYLMILARYIQIKFTKNIHTTNETAYFTNEVLYFISRIEHILRKININPKKGISIIGLFSKI